MGGGYYIVRAIPNASKLIALLHSQLPTTWKPNCSDWPLLHQANYDPEKMAAHLRDAFHHRFYWGSATLADALAKLGPVQAVDSIGGGWIFLKAEVHRLGALFATDFLIGADWGHPGYDGIETEGLCWTAKWLGYRCWLAGRAIVQHSPG